MEIGQIVGIVGFKVKPGITGTKVEIGGELYYFSQEAAEEFNRWLEMLKNNLIGENESLGKIGLYKLQDMSALEPCYFSPVIIKRALEANFKKNK